MYFRKKLELPQDAFSQGREIIEEYDEEAESKWRQNHAESVKRQKKIEAEERQKENNDEEISKVLSDFEMMEELTDELENLELQENDTLERLMSGKLKIPEGKKRVAHSNDDQPVFVKTPREINNNDLISQNNQEIIDLLRTYRCKIKEVLRNVKKDDERNVNLFLDLIELKDDIEDDIRKMNDDEDYSESDEKDSDDETTASIEVKVPQEDTKRKVRFSASLEDVKLIESKSEQYEFAQSENNTIQIHFQHSNAKFSSNNKSEDLISHPGEIIKLHSHESPVPVRKSILKNKGKDEKIRETMEEKPVVKVFSSDTKIIGDVVEHKQQESVNKFQDEIIHITAKDEAPKKVSKFRQMRLKS